VIPEFIGTHLRRDVRFLTGSQRIGQNVGDAADLLASLMGGGVVVKTGKEMISAGKNLFTKKTTLQGLDLAGAGADNIFLHELYKKELRELAQQRRLKIDHTKTRQEIIGAFPDTKLPKDERTKLSIPDPEAVGTKHTQLGVRDSKTTNETYKQAREFDEYGKPVRDIDFTDHAYPGNHPNPHQHKWVPNQTGGTLKREKKARPLTPPKKDLREECKQK
jgi:hypothetical protein